MNKNYRGWNFNTSYSTLTSKLFTPSLPETVSFPQTLLFNYKLAEEIGLNYSKDDVEEIAIFFSGNELIDGSSPLAQAYAGHQFGHFNVLGDGRAILLGEHITPLNKRLDIQLKGSGPTTYSRRGDGRATLRSMLREYLISEAMVGLGIPSSRSLAVVKSGEMVYRETKNEGAILTRIAKSHIRVGTFEYARQFLSTDELKDFTFYVINRHYPALKDTVNPALELLKAVINAQADLIVNWMRVGFIHGVMNTDNMSISGETFDYGPCAFMNEYHPDTVFSAIDTNGRYAFGNQAYIAHWNISCFASSLIPLLHSSVNEAIAMAQEVLNTFPEIYQEKWNKMMAAKIGFHLITDSVKQLVNELLEWMLRNEADYTTTFLLIQGVVTQDGIYSDSSFKAWYSNWENELKNLGIKKMEAFETMKPMNPVFIPRNHLVEKVLDDVCTTHNLELFNEFLEVVSTPYTQNDQFKSFQDFPKDKDKVYRTYCGT